MNDKHSAIDIIARGMAASGGGTVVEANPTLEGTEDELTGILIGNAKYKSPPSVVANPTIPDGVTPSTIETLSIDGNYYKTPHKYLHWMTLDISNRSTSIGSTYTYGVIGGYMFIINDRAQPYQNNAVSIIDNTTFSNQLQATGRFYIPTGDGAFNLGIIQRVTLDVYEGIPSRHNIRIYYYDGSDNTTKELTVNAYSWNTIKKIMYSDRVTQLS